MRKQIFLVTIDVPDAVRSSSTRFQIFTALKTSIIDDKNIGAKDLKVEPWNDK